VIDIYKVSHCSVCGGSGTLHLNNKTEFCDICKGTGLVKKEMKKDEYQTTL
jgi:DnaJ-class molecular chaperone